jgi:hypothetical protein
MTSTTALFHAFISNPTTYNRQLYAPRARGWGIVMKWSGIVNYEVGQGFEELHNDLSLQFVKNDGDISRC